MTPFAAVFSVEIRVMLSRFSAKAMLILSLLAGIAVPLLVVALHANIDGSNIMVQSQGQPVQGSQITTFFQNAIGNNVAACMGRVLQARNFFLIPLLILLAAATSFAGERGSNELRESLCQPISRTKLLAGKSLALLSLCGASLLVTYAPSLIIGFGYYEESGAVGAVSMAYLLTLLSDLAIILLAFACGTFSKSSSTATVLTFFFLIANFVLYSLLSFAKFYAPPESAELLVQFAEYLPWKSFSAWENWQKGWLYAPIIGLLGIIASLQGFLYWRFTKMDV